MAALFRVPKPVVVAPPAPPPAPAAAETAAAGARDTEAEAQRVEGRARARGGVAGTIATSARGVLAELPFAASRKSLLGE